MSLILSVYKQFIQSLYTAVRYVVFQTNEDSHCNLLYCNLVGGLQTTKKNRLVTSS